MSGLVFGQPIPREMYAQMVGSRVDHRGRVRKSHAMKDKANPCLRLHGPGPDATTCKNCTHLYRAGGSKTFFKCRLRGKATSGPATDHYAGWPACGKYQEETK